MTSLRVGWPRWRVWLLEIVAVAAGMALIFTGAIWISRPEVVVAARSREAGRYLAGFWDLERNATDAFRWSQTDATIRLYGFDQRAPVLIRARISATRQPGEPLVRLVVDPEDSALRFSVPSAWHESAFLLAAPHDSEGRTLHLRSVVDPPYRGSRALGFAFDQLRANAVYIRWSDRLPDGRRLLFLTLLGLLGYVAIRLAGPPPRRALPLAFSLALALGIGIAIAPTLIGYWLPNVWLGLLIGWMLAILPRIMRALRALRASGARLSRRSASGSSPRAQIAVSLALVGCAQVLLPLRLAWSSAVGWTLLLAGCALLVVVMPAIPPGERRPLRRSTLAMALLAITVVALTARLVALDQLPLGMWRDEARHGLLALRIFDDPGFRPVYVPSVDIPALLFYLASLPVGLFGPLPWTIRLVPAIVGALTPLALYFMACPLFGSRAALIGAGLLAIWAWHIALSRLAFAAALGPPLTLLALGGLWRALQPHPPRARLAWAALAGGATGIAVYSYHPSRLTPILVALAAAIVLGMDLRGWRMAAPYLAVAALIASLLAAPLLVYAGEHSASFSQRIGQTSIFNPDSLAARAPLARVEENVRLNLGLWNELGDRIGRHNLPGAPQLDLVSGALFALGVALALAWWRDRRARLLLVWLLVALAPGIFSIEAPHAVRTVETIAPSAILAGAAGMALLSCRSEVPVWPRRAGRLLVAAVAAVIVVLNVDRYFVRWPAAPAAYGEFYVADTHIGMLARRLAQAPEVRAGDYHIFVPAEPGDDDVLRYLTAGLDVGTFDNGGLSAPVGARALLISRGDNKDPDAQARALLGPRVARLGVGPPSRSSGRPEFVVYGSDATMARAVASALGP